MSIDRRPPTRCLFRRIVVIIDYSAHAVAQTYFPNYVDFLRRYVPQFARKFLWNHTLAYCALVVTRNASATLNCPLQLSPDVFQRAIEEMLSTAPSGEQSVEKSVRLALETLAHSSNYAVQNEILYLTASLMTIDASDVSTVVQCIVNDRVHCNVISFDCQMHLFSEIAKAGKGEHFVPLDELHLRRILAGIAHQRTTEIIAGKFADVMDSSKARAELVCFGFPVVYETSFSNAETVRFCLCHLHVPKSGFDCPRCSARLCGDLPKNCVICGFLSLPAAFMSRVAVEHSKAAMDHAERPIARRKAIVVSGSADMLTENASLITLKREDPETDESIVTEKRKAFCPLCDFPFTRKDGHGPLHGICMEDPLQNLAAVECASCSTCVCLVCAEYIDEFLLVSPCCGALFNGAPVSIS